MVCGEICSILVAVLFPPLGICCYKGCGSETWICLLLFILVPYVGGLIYAIYVICKSEPKHQPVQVVVHQTTAA